VRLSIVRTLQQTTLADLASWPASDPAAPAAGEQFAPDAALASLNPEPRPLATGA
jgi:hypothetical protein